MEIKNIDAALTAATNKIEQECDMKNAAFLLSLILLYIDPTTWTVDKTIFNRIYQAIDIVEKDETLKQLYGKGANNA